MDQPLRRRSTTSAGGCGTTARKRRRTGRWARCSCRARGRSPGCAGSAAPRAAGATSASAAPSSSGGCIRAARRASLAWRRSGRCEAAHAKLAGELWWRLARASHGSRASPPMLLSSQQCLIVPHRQTGAERRRAIGAEAPSFVRASSPCGARRGCLRTARPPRWRARRQARTPCGRTLRPCVG